jgi:hypothetical protein
MRLVAFVRPLFAMPLVASIHISASASSTLCLTVVYTVISSVVYEPKTHIVQPFGQPS